MDFKTNIPLCLEDGGNIFLSNTDLYQTVWYLIPDNNNIDSYLSLIDFITIMESVSLYIFIVSCVSFYTLQYIIWQYGYAKLQHISPHLYLLIFSIKNLKLLKEIEFHLLSFLEYDCKMRYW
jgi:hypothetical protein